jgi:hypothetical protein
MDFPSAPWREAAEQGEQIPRWPTCRRCWREGPVDVGGNCVDCIAEELARRSRPRPDHPRGASFPARDSLARRSERFDES